MVKSPLRYPGGKSKVAHKLVSLSEKSDYLVEPFVGGGSFFIEYLKKYPKTKVIISDKNRDLFCFWFSVIYNGNSLVDCVKDAFYSKNLYNSPEKFYRYWKQEIVQVNHIVSAVRFFVLNRITFSGTTDSGGFSNQCFNKRFTRSSIDRLQYVVEFLKDKDISCYNYSIEELFESEELMKKELFCYFDPPYFSNKSSKLYGKNGDLHDNFDHDKLFYIINEYKNNMNFIMTYDNCDEIKEKYKNFFIEYLDMSYSITNLRGNETKELLISNYRCNK